jgi:hypothetical protein
MNVESNYSENELTQMPSFQPISKFWRSCSHPIPSGNMINSLLAAGDLHDSFAAFDPTSPSFTFSFLSSSIPDVPSGSPVFDSGNEINAPSATAPWRVGVLTHGNASLDNRPHKRKTSLKSSHDASESMVEILSRNVLREDFYSFLESELPRWTSKGLWHETPQKLMEPNSTTIITTTTTRTRRSVSSPLSSYSKLERAYLAVCQLNSRMGDDLVRNRIALIQLHLEYTETHQGRRHTSARNRVESTVGRGGASHVIDHILENIHKGWNALDQQRRARLRADFLDRKKYGKRWSQLANALGPGILLICSKKLANALYVSLTLKCLAVDFSC